MQVVFARGAEANSNEKRLVTDATHVDRTILGLAGFAVVALMLPGVAVAILYPAPSPGAAAALVAHLARYRSLVLASVFLAALGWGGVLLVFAAALYAVLGRAEGGAAIWSHVAFVGCAATAVAILTVLTFFGIVAYRVPAIDPETASVLYDAGGIANLMTAFPNAIYVIASAIVIVRTSVFPRWTAHGALLVAAIHLASAVSWAREGAFGPLGVLPSVAPLSHTAWIAAIAATSLRRGR